MRSILVLLMIMVIGTSVQAQSSIQIIPGANGAFQVSYAFSKGEYVVQALVFAQDKPVTGAGEFITILNNPKVIAQTNAVTKGSKIPDYAKYVVFYAMKRNDKKNTYIKLGEFSRQQLTN